MSDVIRNKKCGIKEMRLLDRLSWCKEVREDRESDSEVKRLL